MREWTRAELQSVPESQGTLAISARTGDGLPALLEQIGTVLDAQQQPLSADTPMLTRERHRLALERASGEMKGFVGAWASEDRVPAIVAAVHLHSARAHLEELVGVLDVEDVLDRLFASFCVGK
jgi:tRNA modification GTPase